MASQHKQRQGSWRPDPDEYETTKSLLSARGKNITGFMRACMRWLRHDPDAALAVLAEHWPSPRRFGRPPRQDTDQQPVEQADGATA